MKRWRQTLGLVFIGTLLGVLFVVFGLYARPQTAHATAGINHQINFQGKVTNPNGTNVTNGTYTFVFKLYTVSSGGSATWTETDSLTVTDGVFQVPLGAVTALPGSVDFNTDNIYLGITFNSDPAGEMSPRIQLTASPYAFNSEKLGGLAASAFVQLSPSGQQTGNVNVSGSGRFDGGLTVASGGTITGNLQIGAAGGTAGALLFNNSGNSNAVTLQAGSGSAAYSLTLPTSGLAVSKCLATDSVTASQLTFASCGGGGGVTTVGAFSGSSQANGATIAGTTITFGPADGTNPGMVSTGTQTLAGNKTLTGNTVFTGTAAVQNTGTTAFQVQSASGSSTLLTADTTNLKLTVANAGPLDSFQTDTSMPGAVIIPGSTYYNGHYYVVGGVDTTTTYLTTVRMATANADGTLDWTTLSGTPFPASLAAMNIIAANGYLYSFGGYDGATYQTSFYYTKINADGTLAGWVTGTNLAAARGAASVLFVNGYIYLIGGTNGTSVNTTLYAKVNADGSLGTWTAGTTLTFPTAVTSAVTANNFIYLFGGIDDVGTQHNDTQYASINPLTGAIGAWSTTNDFSTTLYDATTAVIANGNIYVIGGENGTTPTRDMSYATPNADGTLSTFTTVTNALPAARSYGMAFTANGYVYYLGGTSTNAPANGSATVYYASTAGRLQVRGSLDLVGGTNGSLTANSGGGSLTAGNTIIVGTLSTQEAASFMQGVTIGGDLAVSGAAILQNTANSTSAFQVQRSAGSDVLFTVDTTNNKIVVGNSTGTNTNTSLLVVDSATGDPTTGYNGAIYYNTVTSKFRCYQNNTWQDCINNFNGATAAVTANSTASFTSGLQNVAANTSGQVVEMMLFTSSTAVSNVAGVTGFTAPASGSFRTCLVKNNAAITAGTLGLRWRVNGASVGSSVCNMNSTTNRQSATALDAGVVTFSAGDTIGLAIDTNAAYLPTTDDYTVYWTIEYNTSSGNPLTMQYVYDQQAAPAGITTTNNKDINFVLAETATDSSLVVNMQCATCSASGGRFAVQVAGTDTFSLTPVTGAAKFTNASNSTTAFRVQNQSGNDVFDVDTTNGQVILGKASTINGQIVFNNTAGANTVSLGTGSTSSSYSILFPTAGGSASQCLQLGGGGGSQLQWGACGTNSTGLTKNAADTSSASVSAASFLYGFTNSGSAATGGVLKLDNGTNTGSAIQIVGTGNSGAGNAYIFAKNSNASPSGNLLDLQNNVSSGTDLFTVSATGSVTHKTTTNSTTAFQLLNSSGTAIVTVDNSTSPARLQIGSSATDATAVLTVLDSYNTTDPAGTNGGMYYSTLTNTFRCYENSAWADCLSHHVIVLGADVASTASTSFQTLTGLSFAMTSGTTYRFHAQLLYTTSAATIGTRVAVTGPANPTFLAYTTETVLSTTGSAAAGWHNQQNTYDAGTASTSSIATTIGNLITMDGVIKPSASANLQVDFAPETATANGNVYRAGSTLEWW